MSPKKSAALCEPNAKKSLLPQGEPLASRVDHRPERARISRRPSSSSLMSPKKSAALCETNAKESLLPRGRTARLALGLPAGARKNFPTAKLFLLCETSAKKSFLSRR
jgi:hypothetical protein